MTIEFSDIPILQNKNVKMRCPDDVLEKINCIISDKKENLQIIMDYDLTMTKQHVNGQKTLSSFGLLSMWDKLPSGFMTKNMEISAKYFPIEYDLNMSVEEKIPWMVDWYRQSESLWKGIQVNLEELFPLIVEKGPALRDGSVELCKTLETNKIPLLILSAGLGDVVREVLKYHGLTENNYFHIISNFFRLKDNVIEGYGCKENGFYIHPFNKSGLGSHYFNSIGHRNNVILMGDSLGDAKMNEGLPETKVVLKIGFLYGTENMVEQYLPKFMQCFDIVLVDDQTMNVLRAIIDLVIQL